MAKKTSQGAVVYVICSDDPLLKMDRTAELMVDARQQLPNADFLLYTYSDFMSGANVQQFESELSDPGLFGGDRIIKINLKDLDAQAVEILNLIAANDRPGLFIIVDMPRITSTYNKGAAKDPEPLRRFLSFAPGSEGAKAAESKGKAGKAASLETRKKDAISYIKGIGGSVEIIYPPEDQGLLTWISERAAKYGKQIQPDAVDFIARACDNNLLAIDQSLKLIELLFEGQTITMKEVDEYFTQDARYNGYELPKAICDRDAIKALNVLSSFCNGPGSSLGASLGFLLMRLEECFNVVIKGRRMGINAKTPYRDKTAFFMSHGVKVASSQNSYLKAMSEMPEALLDHLVNTLSEASIAYSTLDNDGCYRALQRIAVAAGQKSHVLQLERLSNNFMR